jgi:ABC-2 type transport system permease protein
VLQYYPGINPLNWYVPLNALQGAAFGGIFLGFAAIRDFQTGFYDRLLAAPAPRRSLLLGPMLAAVIRALFPVAVVLAIGFAGGMTVPGGPIGLVLLLLSCWGVCLIGTLYAHGLAFRFKSMSAAPLMQVGVFVLVFLSEAQVPIEGMTGWLEVVARLNPATYIMRMARAGFLGDVTWTVVWHGLVATAVLAVPTLVFAERGLRRLGR